MRGRFFQASRKALGERHVAVGTSDPVMGECVSKLFNLFSAGLVVAPFSR